MKTICSICHGITKITPEKVSDSHTICRGCFPDYMRSIGEGDLIDELIDGAQPVIAREEKICPANR